MTGSPIAGRPPGSDVAALTALVDRLCRAWSDGDGAAYGACFTPDCTYVSFDGARRQGRGAVAASHDVLFRGVLYGSRLVAEVDAVRALSCDVALVHATTWVVVAWRSRPPARRRTRSTLVAVRGPAGWLVACLHNGRVRPLRVPGADSPPALGARLLVRAARRAGIARGAPSEPVSEPE